MCEDHFLLALFFCALDKAMVDPEGFEPSTSEYVRIPSALYHPELRTHISATGYERILGLETKMSFLLVITAAFASPQTIKLKYPVA